MMTEEEAIAALQICIDAMKYINKLLDDMTMRCAEELERQTMGGDYHG